MIAQPYCRTSKDDAGQDPKRQMDVIKPWAEREGISLLPPVIDEGTSAHKVSPFERPKFREAVRLAAKHKADGVVFESIDRMTREGIKMWYRTAFKLEDNYGLELHWADMPLAMQEGMAGQVILAVRAGMAHDIAKRMSESTKSGLERAKAKGKKLGRPRKHIGEDEVRLAIRLKERMGWDSVAHEINRRRGVFEIVDPKSRKKRSTSGASLRRAVREYSEDNDGLQNGRPAKVSEEQVEN